MESADLTFVATEELIQELMRRHRAIVIAREMDAPVGNGKRDTLYDYDGGVSTCIGLADRARYRLLRLAEDSVEEQED